MLVSTEGSGTWERQFDAQEAYKGLYLGVPGINPYNGIIRKYLKFLNIGISCGRKREKFSSFAFNQKKGF